MWWFPGTSDPNKPCYGYWSAKDSSKRPVQFFGLSSLGPTILDYYTFSKAPPGKSLNIYYYVWYLLASYVCIVVLSVVVFGYTV